MKKFLVFLIPVILTVAMFLFPEYYFKESDESYLEYALYEDLNIQVAEDISVNKLIEIAADENSRYVESPVKENSDVDNEIGFDILSQLEEILGTEISDKEGVVKNAYYNKMQVIGNSEFNSYVFSLCALKIELDNMGFDVVYIPESEQILSAWCYSFNDAAGVWIKEAGRIEEMLDKYFGEDNWSAEIGESELFFYQGQDLYAIEKIQNKMCYEGEEEFYN